MAKITTTEVGEVYYKVEYEVPNEIAEEIENLDEEEKTEEIKNILEKYGEIKYSEQENDGEAFEVKLESIDKIEID